MPRLLVLPLLVIMILSSVPVRAGTKSREIRLDPQVALAATKGVVEEHLAGILRTARVIAVTPEARTARWEVVRPLLDRFANDLATEATIWFALPDGRYFVTESGGVASQNLNDRPYFPRLFAGQEVFGDLVISRATGYRSVIVATPVIMNGKVVAAVGVSVRVDLLSKLVESNTKLPAGVYFYALAPDTRIALHRHADRMFKTVSDVGDEKLGAAFIAIMNNDQGVFTYTLDGRNMISVFRKSTPLGWYFFIAKQRS